MQGRLEENRLERREGDNAIEPSLLTGILFDASSQPMTPTHAVKKGTRYRYYVSRRLIAGIDADNSDGRIDGQRLPAVNLEALVTGRLRSLVADPVEILNSIAPGEHEAPAQRRISDAAAALAVRWDGMPNEEPRRAMRSLIVRAQVHADRIDLDVSATQLARTLLSDGGADWVPDFNAHDAGSEEDLVRLTIPARLKRTGKEMKFIVDGPTSSAPVDTSLIRLLVRAQKIGERLFEIGGPNLDQIAGEENITPSNASRIVRLKFLAPDIVAAILAGKQPPELTANKLLADTRLPLDWRAQRTALGFA